MAKKPETSQFEVDPADQEDAKREDLGANERRGALGCANRRSGRGQSGPLCLQRW